MKKAITLLLAVCIIILTAFPAIAQTESGGEAPDASTEQHPEIKDAQEPTASPGTTATSGTVGGADGGEPEENEPDSPEAPAQIEKKGFTIEVNPSAGTLLAALPGSQPAMIVADNHNFMLRIDTRLFGWGDNTFGQLGLGFGAPTKVYEPTEITFFADNGLNIKDITVIQDASFVLCSNGEVYTCGKGLNGRLGLGSTANVDTWTLVNGSKDLRFDKLYGGSGQEYIIAVSANNELYGWGRNFYGQVGNGTKVDVLVPTKIMSNADVKYLETGIDFVFLIKQDNSAWVWGNNANGRYGFDAGTVLPSNEELVMDNCVNPSGGSCTKHVNAGSGCYGKTFSYPCDSPRWSSFNQYTGIKGNSINCIVKDFLSPRAIVIGANRTFVGIDTIFVETPTGTPDSSSNNTFKFKSTDLYTHTHWAYPSLSIGPECSLPGAKDATAIATGKWQYVLPNGFEYFDTGKTTEIQIGSRHGVVNIDGIYYGWGDNSLKQQGTSGNNNGYMVPLTQINNFISELNNSGGGFSSLNVADDTNYIISGTGNVFTWGSNTNGKAGIGSTISYIDTPTQVNALNGKSTSTIVAGRNHALALTHTGDVYAMGDNYYGQLGLGSAYEDEIKASTPVLIETFKFSSTAVVPDAPDNIDTPDEVEAGTNFEINWTNVGAQKYEIVRHFTPESSTVMTFGANAPLEEVVYIGDQTTFTDTIHEEGTAYYTGRAISFLGDYSSPAASNDIVVLPSSGSGNGGNNDGDNDNNGGDNNNNGGNNNNNGGGLTNDQLAQLILALKSSGTSDELITELIAANKKSSGDISVNVPASGMDDKTLSELITALAANKGENSGQTGTPATNVYNQPSDLSPLMELLGANAVDLDKVMQFDAVDTAIKVATLDMLNKLSMQSANTNAAAEPVYHQLQAVNGFTVKQLNVFVIIIMFVAAGALIIVRIIVVLMKREGYN